LLKIVFMRKIYLFFALIFTSLSAFSQDSSVEQTKLMVYLIGYIVVFAVSILIIRAVFNIPTIVKNLKVQTSLLNEIAKAQGVAPEALKECNKPLNN
jgi:hypothetical protein